MKREMPWLLFACIFPTLLAWGYFIVLAGTGLAQQAAFSLGKGAQLLLPIVLYWWWEGHCPWPSRPHFAGLGLGVAFAVSTVAAMLGVYHFWLKQTPLFEATPAIVNKEMMSMGLATPVRYLLFAVFLSIPHSLLEEYYWRWFVFGRMRKYISFRWACLLSSLGFMGHHVIIVGVYVPDYFWVGAVPLSLTIAVGGAVWAWLYERTGAIYAGWLSHGIVDVGLFIVGYDLLRDTLFQ
jgi:membrane protease YdiL (CAAX protease family)